MKEERNCAFQYFNGYKIVVDKTGLTLTEAKQLFNDYYDDMIKCQLDGYNKGIEVVIWINMKDSNSYEETLIHLFDPEIRDNQFVEIKYINKFNL